MLDRQMQQISLADSFIPNDLVPDDDILCQISAVIDRVIDVEDFEGIYSKDRGRRAYCPVMMTKINIFKEILGISDREAEERTRYDLRWKKALGLPVDHKGIDHSTICVARLRIIKNDLDRKVFVRSVEECVKEGLIKDPSFQVIDSTLIWGRAATQDTYTMIKECIRKILRQAPEDIREVIKAEIGDYYEQSGKPDIDWDDPEARRQLLEELVQDAESVVRILSGCDIEELQPLVELLSRWPSRISSATKKAGCI